MYGLDSSTLQQCGENFGAVNHDKLPNQQPLVMGIVFEFIVVSDFTWIY